MKRQAGITGKCAQCKKNKISMYYKCIVNALLMYSAECPGPADSCLLWANYTDDEEMGEEDVGGDEANEANEADEGFEGGEVVESDDEIA